MPSAVFYTKVLVMPCDVMQRENTTLEIFT
jgi:hypothetical protein